MTTTFIHARPLIFSLCSCLALAACTPGDDVADAGDTSGQTDAETGTETETETDTGDEMSPAIAGTYVDEWGDMHTITGEAWSNSAGSFAIDQWDDEQMWLVAQNAETNEYNPGLWSRFDWAWAGDQLYYCQSVYDGAAIDDALAGSADAGDLEGMGCGGFAWTKLDPS